MTTIKQQLRELHEELERLAPEYDLLTPVQENDLINMLSEAAQALRQQQEEWQEKQDKEAHEAAGIACPPAKRGSGNWFRTDTAPWDYTCPICGKHWDWYLTPQWSAKA